MRRTIALIVGTAVAAGAVSAAVADAGARNATSASRRASHAGVGLGGHDGQPGWTYRTTALRLRRPRGMYRIRTVLHARDESPGPIFYKLSVRGNFPEAHRELGSRHGSMAQGSHTVDMRVRVSPRLTAVVFLVEVWDTDGDGSLRSRLLIVRPCYPPCYIQK